MGGDDGRPGPMHAPGVAPRMEPVEGHSGAMVAGKFEGGVQHRLGRPGQGAERFLRRPDGEAGSPGGMAPSEVAALSPGGPGDDRRLRRGRRPPRPVGEDRDAAHQGTYRKLLSRVYARTARVVSVVVSEQAGRWYASFTVEVEREAVETPAGPVVGVDLGVKHLAVLSSGEQVANPRRLSKWQRRLARQQAELARRKAPAKGRRASKGCQQSKARLARTHRKVANAGSTGCTGSPRGWRKPTGRSRSKPSPSKA